jgi:hypothetical protein
VGHPFPLVHEDRPWGTLRVFPQPVKPYPSELQIHKGCLVLGERDGVDFEGAWVFVL